MITVLSESKPVARIMLKTRLVRSVIPANRAIKFYDMFFRFSLLIIEEQEKLRI